MTPVKCAIGLLLSAACWCALYVRAYEQKSGFQFTFDVDSILNNRRLLDAYTRCYLDNGPCPGPSREAKTSELAKEEATIEEPVSVQDTQVVLNVEELNEIIKKSIAFGISSEDIYNPEKLNKWCTNITEECIQRLADLKKPFKYIVFCDVRQNDGTAMLHAITTVWDRLKDRIFSQAWSNRTIQVVVSVLGVCTEISREAL